MVGDDQNQSAAKALIDHYSELLQPFGHFQYWSYSGIPSQACAIRDQLGEHDL